jgi:hypothetical protein
MSVYFGTVSLNTCAHCALLSRTDACVRVDLTAYVSRGASEKLYVRFWRSFMQSLLLSQRGNFILSMNHIHHFSVFYIPLKNYRDMLILSFLLACFLSGRTV